MPAVRERVVIYSAELAAWLTAAEAKAILESLDWYFWGGVISTITPAKSKEAWLCRQPGVGR
jgi:hypothetical protein